MAGADPKHQQLEALNWPHRDKSRFIEIDGHHHHVQIFGEGPDLLLLHGTGASGHSFAGLAPLLAQRRRVIVPDLPGHGFTDLPRPGALSIDRVAGTMARLLAALDADPVAVVGHSAGAAVLVRMGLTGAIAPEIPIIGLNAAILPFRGAPNFLFPAIAKLLFLNPMTPRLFSATISPRGVKRLIDSTGSRPGAEAERRYLQLLKRPDHVAGALGMMANWQLDPLVDALPSLPQRLFVVSGMKDSAVPPEDAHKICYLAREARYIDLDGRGHLAHEEAPDEIAAVIEDLLSGTSLSSE